MTLTVHLLRVMGRRILVAMAVLLALLQLLELLEVTPDILHRKLGLMGVATYLGLSAPHMIAQAAPLAVLAGCLFGFTKLARENAVVALRGAGVSAYRLTLAAAPATVGVFVLALALSVFGVSRADQRLADWWRTAVPAERREAREARTFHLGADIVTAAPGDEAGRRLKDVTLYTRDAHGRLTRLIAAAQAEYGPAGWILHGVGVRTFGADGATEQTTVPVLRWTATLTPIDVRALFQKEPVISWDGARRALGGGAATQAPVFYRMHLQRIWAGPFGVLVMLLVAAPSALATFRDGRGGRISAFCLAGGLGFMVADGVAVSMGMSGTLPVLVAAWIAPIVFAAGAATALLYLEG